MTIYIRNIADARLDKIIKKIRKSLRESEYPKLVTVEIYIVGEARKDTSVYAMGKLITLTIYLLQIQNHCTVQLTFRGYIGFEESLLFFTPFKKWVSTEVASAHEIILLKDDDRAIDISIQKYKALVGFIPNTSNDSIPLLQMPNTYLI